MDGLEPALHLRVLSRVSEVPAAQWDALLDGACTPFQRWDWLDAMESNGCAAPAQGWHPRHLTLWRGDLLVAAAPMYRRDDSAGEFVFDHGWVRPRGRRAFATFPSW